MSFAPNLCSSLQGRYSTGYCRRDDIFRDRTVTLEWTLLVLPWSFEQEERFRVARTTKGTNTVATLSLMAYSVLYANSSSNNDNQD